MMEKTETKSVLSLRFVLIGILVVLITNYGFYSVAKDWQLHTNFHHRASLAINFFDHLLSAWAVSFAFILLITIINRVRPIFSARQVAIVSFMILVSLSVYIGGDGSWYMSWEFLSDMVLATASGPEAGTPKNLYDNIVQYMPWNLKMPFGRPPFPVGSLFSITGFNALFFGSLVLTTLFMLMLFRRQWMDVEQLQFPWAEIETELIDTSQKENKQKSWSNNYFLLAFLAAFTIEAANWILCLFRPQIFDGRGLWYGQMIHPPSLWFGTLPGHDLMQGWSTLIYMDTYPYADFRTAWGPLGIWFIMPFACWWLAPWTLGYSLVLSLDTLIGFIVSHIGLYVVLGGIMSAPQYSWYDPFGIYLPWAYTTGLGQRLVGQGYLILIAFAFGVMATMVFRPIITNWRQMKPVFTALVHEPPKEFDSNKPIGYRLTWLGFIGFFALSVLSAWVANISLPMFVTWFVLVLAGILLTARYIAESGGMLGIFVDAQIGIASWSGFLMGLMLLMFQGSILSEVSAVNVTSVWYLWVFTTSWLTCIPLMAFMAFRGFHIAKLKMISLKDMLIAALIAIAVALPVQFLERIDWFVYGGIWSRLLLPDHLAMGKALGWVDNLALGRTSGPWYFGLSWNFNEIVRNIEKGDPFAFFLGGGGITPNYFTVVVADPDWQITFVALFAAGIATGIFIPWLRARRTWMRVGLGGLVLGAIWGYYLWLPVYLAFITKFIVIRYRGVREYQTKLLPLAIGLVAGNLLSWFLFGSPSFLRAYWTSQAWLRDLDFIG